MMSNLVKLWTGKSMNIHRSFVTTIWNQVMSLLSVKLSGTHRVSCTVMVTWHRVLHLCVALKIKSASCISFDKRKDIDCLK